eukprot:COSAG04_NODE_24630_length_319_cov_0.700000_2_plen_34_part_01
MRDRLEHKTRCKKTVWCEIFAACCGQVVDGFEAA